MVTHIFGSKRHQGTLPCKHATAWSEKKDNAALQWRHNERHVVPNYRQLYCLFNILFRISSKATSMPKLLAFCEGILRWPVNSYHKGSATRKVCPCHDVIIESTPFRCCGMWAIKPVSSVRSVSPFFKWAKEDFINYISRPYLAGATAI